MFSSTWNFKILNSRETFVNVEDVEIQRVQKGHVSSHGWNSKSQQENTIFLNTKGTTVFTNVRNPNTTNSQKKSCRKNSSESLGFNPQTNGPLSTLEVEFQNPYFSRLTFEIPIKSKEIEILRISKDHIRHFRWLKFEVLVKIIKHVREQAVVSY